MARRSTDRTFRLPDTSTTVQTTEDRKEWRGHRLKFVQNVKSPVLYKLLDDLQHEAVFTTAEVESIKCKPARRNQARALIGMVMNKGREAKGILLDCIRNRDPLLAYQMKILTEQGLVDLISVQQELPVQETSPPDPAHSEEWLTTCSKEFVQKIQREQAGQIYNILDKQSRTRLALIINNEKFDSLGERKGSEHDETQMERLLEELGYEVEVLSNLTSKEMETSLTDFSKRSEHERSDSTFIVLMSHGLKDTICGTDYQDEKTGVLKVDTIFEIFNNKNCKGLRNKPKVIIMQACRGEDKAYVLVSDSNHKADDACPVPSGMGLEDDAMKKVLIESDFFCLCSSTPDTKSWRNIYTGSIFIQPLVEIMRKEACTESLEELFRKVRLSVSETMLEVPTLERTTALKKFYLFPGY